MNEKLKLKRAVKIVTESKIYAIIKTTTVFTIVKTRVLLIWNSINRKHLYGVAAVLLPYIAYVIHDNYDLNSINLDSVLVALQYVVDYLDVIATAIVIIVSATAGIFRVKKNRKIKKEEK